MELKSPKGTSFSVMSDGQLKFILQPKTISTPEMRAGAELLLGQPGAEAWSSWYALATQASDLGIEPPQPDDGVSAIGLYRMQRALAEQIAAKNAAPVQ